MKDSEALSAARTELSVAVRACIREAHTAQAEGRYICVPYDTFMELIASSSALMVAEHMARIS